MSAVTNWDKKRRLWSMYNCLHPNSSIMYKFLGEVNAALSAHCPSKDHEWSVNEYRIIASTVHDPFDVLDVMRGCVASLRTPYSVWNAWMNIMWSNLEKGDTKMFIQAKLSMKAHEIK